MEYRQLGRSGLRVSALALGTAPFGGHQIPEVGHVDVPTARAMLDTALEAGVNLIDTADVYGFGNAERVVGEITQGRRNDVLIATKCRSITGEDPNWGGLSRKHIIMSVEHSLRRLRTDHIDLFQTHGWDGQTALDEVTSALDQLVQDGKVRYLGCSNYSGWHVMKSLAAADRLGAERVVSQQIHYTILNREAEFELIPLGLDQGVGVMVWSPLAAGLLTGDFVRGADDERLAAWREPPVASADRVYDIVDVLREVGERHGASPAQIAMAFTLSRPNVASVILGPRTEQHLADSLGAIDVVLDVDDLERLDLVSRPQLPYPYWHQARSATDRLGAADRSLHSGTDRDQRRGTGSKPQ